jgi:hypothetical protein
LVANLTASKTFYIAVARGGAYTVTVSPTPIASAIQTTTNAGGVLAFSVNGSGIVPIDTKSPPPPTLGPGLSAPMNVRIVN